MTDTDVDRHLGLLRTQLTHLYGASGFYHSWLKIDVTESFQLADFIRDSAAVLQFCKRGNLTPDNLAVNNKQEADENGIELNWTTWTFACLLNPRFCPLVLSAWQAYLHVIPHLLLRTRKICGALPQELQTEVDAIQQCAPVKWTEDPAESIGRI